ncbi:hypothetical protein SCNU_17485 [Gordonia neofelifaecis NRRL B-59395]|uniref:Uncharacterized protein n=1 Tax=Gordonia neofelifaecis NRRL B-59395 TaxID=644548 RepID=F1YNL5_9ACTN|nr:hypothetical protein [Gordonia neofelifaecis]EGD53752.1 hypothetical protein SCNU_17485 [Gordonia neofelifaecis NRRL B-59395]
MRRITRTGITLIATAAAVGVTIAASPAPAGAAPAKRCVIDQTDATRTVASLMSDCSTGEILGLFADAPLGLMPTGTKTLSLLPVFQISGDALPYDSAKALTRAQSVLGDALTFTRRGGQPWVYKNYAWGLDAGAAVTRGVSRVDGRPVYAADFAADFNGYRISLHEYRQLTPTVWIARDIGGGDKPTTTPTGGVIALS